MKVFRAFLFAIVALASVGVAQAQYSGSDYGTGAVRSAQNVRGAIVVDILPANINEEASGTSRVIGATAGAAVCAPIASRWHSWAAQAAAMTLCGAVGERVGNRVGQTQAAAQTIVIRFDDGQMQAVVQNDPYIQRGERVYVLTGSGGTRIMRAGV